jgi:glutaredoxin
MGEMNSQNGDEVRRGSRCEKHGLVVGPDGLCVLCRRQDKPESHVASAETKSPAKRMLTVLPGLLALAFIAFLIWTGVGSSSSPDNKMPAEKAENQEQDNEEDYDEDEPEPDAEDQDDFDEVRAAQERIEAKKAAKARLESRQAERNQQGKTAGRDREREQLLERAKKKQAIENARDDVEIIVYITSWCPVCTQALKYMQTKGISFRKYDIDNDSAAKKRLGSLNSKRSIPTFTIDGKVSVGFSPGSLENAINKAAKRRAQKKGW